MRQRISKTQLINPMCEDRMETDSYDSIDTDSDMGIDLCSVEIINSAEKYGPADPGLDTTNMPK